MNRWLIVIPARLASTRLPKKPLQDLAGKPLIIRVYENLLPLLKEGAEIVVATDSDEVLSVCKANKVNAVLTREDHPSGTDRCNEVAQNFDRDFILNVQGDEPFVKLEDLKSLVNLLETGVFSMGTVGCKSTNVDDFADPNTVKIASSQDKTALYFSRSGIPSIARQTNKDNFSFWQHIGIYAYKKTTLDKICSLSPSPLEITESLEQLRALENGIKIGVVETKNPSIGIDTQKDLENARALFH